jgi:hypothetical protein
MPTRVLTPEYLNGIFKGLKVTPQRAYLLPTHVDRFISTIHRSLNSEIFIL